jgi:hypothetical protein
VLQVDVSQCTQDAATLNRLGAEMRRLWAEGVAGRATIQRAHDTGERLAGNAVLDLELLVLVAGHEPYAARLRTPIGGTDVTPYGPGAQYNVKVDPHDPHNLTFAG